MTLVRLTLHNKRFDTKEISARQEEEKGNGLKYVVDDVALVIRKEAHVTCYIFHVKLVKDIILNWHMVYWESFCFQSYAQMRSLLLFFF